MTEADMDFDGEGLSNAMKQAETAAALGDIDAAERWTRLAERQAGLIAQFIAEFRKAGIDVAALVEKHQPARRARRAREPKSA